MSASSVRIDLPGPSYWLSREARGDLDFLYSDGRGHLPASEQQRLIQEFADAMPGYNPVQYYATQPGIFNKYEHLIVATSRCDGRAIGLLGARWFEDQDLRFLYIWTGMVATFNQRRGLTVAMFGHLITAILRHHPKPPVIAAKTYSPLWYKVMARLTASIPGAALYPTIGSGLQPALAKVAADVHRQLTPTLPFDLQTGVIRGAQAVVGPDFFPKDRPLSGTAHLDDYFQTNVSREDQVLTCIDLSRVDQLTLRSALEKMMETPRAAD